MPAKPKLRMAPSLDALAEKQEAAQRLLKLGAWTEEPNNPPAEGVAAVLTPATLAPPVVQKKVKPVPEVPLKPWQVPSADAVHPYHTVLPERLFQKIDYAWKRKGFKSMKEWVLLTLEAEANKMLKDLGEK